MSGSKLLSTVENNSCTVSFMHLRLRRKCKEDYVKVGGSKVGIGLQESETQALEEGV